jgi:HTH-type transcriptional regulator / antitoxin MqsA
MSGTWRGNPMCNCHVCGNKTARDEIVSEVFEIDGRRVLVEQIPAMVCERCGEATYSGETGERVRRLLHEDPKPSRTETLEVFALPNP